MIRCSLLPDQSTYRLNGDFYLVDKANSFLKIAEARNLSLLTVRVYGNDLVSFFRWLEKTGKKFGSVKHADLFDFVLEQKKRDFKANTINRKLTTVQVFYRFCYGKDIPRGPGSFGPNPYFKNVRRHFLKGIKHLPKQSSKLLRVKAPKPVVEPLTPEQVNEFFQTLKKYRDLAIVQLMLLCGLRAFEVLSLGLDSVDFSEERVLVYGKGRKERMLPLPKLVGSTIQRYLKFERPKECNTQRLFVVLQGEKRGQAMNYDGLRSLFRLRRKRRGLKNANPHRWRHTFGANMAKQKVALPVLQRMMGHCDPSVTMNYIHLSMADIADEFKKASANIEKIYDN